MNLIKYDAACRAIAEAKEVDEVKDLRDKADAMRQYARQAKNKQLEVDAAEIRLRAERKLGEIIHAQKETVGLAKGGQPHHSTGQDTGPVETMPTLAEVGISKNLSSHSQKLAAVSDADFEGQIEDWRDRVSKEGERVTTSFSRVASFTGETEWYTPDEYIESARRVMGGIDLDPASSEFAQLTVKARVCYTTDGLDLDWAGKVWLNPPYKFPLVQDFIRKLIASPIEQAVLLTNNATDTQWWHDAANASSAICFHLGRISFYQEFGDKNAPTHGQTFFYFGEDTHLFHREFGRFGLMR